PGEVLEQPSPERGRPSAGVGVVGEAGEQADDVLVDLRLELELEAADLASTLGTPGEVDEVGHPLHDQEELAQVAVVQASGRVGVAEHGQRPTVDVEPELELPASLAQEELLAGRPAGRDVVAIRLLEQ